MQELYAIELPRSRGRRRVDGAGRRIFDFHAGAPGRVHGDGADPRGRRHRLNSRVKGGASWYYGDFYVRLGIDPEPFPPRPGDTLLHMALRHKRSASFVATILHLGADKEIANNCGEKAYELDPAAFKLAEALVEQ